MLDSLASGDKEVLQSQRSGDSVPIYFEMSTKSQKRSWEIRFRVRGIDVGSWQGKVGLTTEGGWCVCYSF